MKMKDIKEKILKNNLLGFFIGLITLSLFSYAIVSPIVYVLNTYAERVIQKDPLMIGERFIYHYMKHAEPNLLKQDAVSDFEFLNKIDKLNHKYFYELVPPFSFNDSDDNIEVKSYDRINDSMVSVAYRFKWSYPFPIDLLYPLTLIETEHNVWKVADFSFENNYKQAAINHVVAWFFIEEHGDLPDIELYVKYRIPDATKEEIMNSVDSFIFKMQDLCAYSPMHKFCNLKPVIKSKIENF